MKGKRCAVYSQNHLPACVTIDMALYVGLPPTISNFYYRRRPLQPSLFPAQLLDPGSEAISHVLIGLQ